MITVVTAFFNINRANWKNFERGTNVYIESFAKWAHLKNQLVVFVENEDIQNEVYRIREKYNLKDQTLVEIIPEIREIDKSLYDSLKYVENNNEVHKLWRMGKKSPEVSKADYNYIMCMKFWLLKYAVEKYKIESNVAWVDFGFAHNGSIFPFEEDFDFNWDYDFGEKITLFSLKDIDNRPVFDIVNTMDTYIMGCISVYPSHYCSLFWELIRDSMLSLTDVGYMDDDQILLLMAYRKRPDIIQLIKSDWFLPIKEYGNSNMRVKQFTKKESSMKQLLRKQKRFLERLNYYKGLERHLRKIKL